MTKLLLLSTVSVLSISACGPNRYSHELQTSDTAIIGGSDVSITDRIGKSVVAVYDDATGQLCSGVLIGKNIVMTAAHCIGPDLNAMYVYFDLTVTAQSPFNEVTKLEVSPTWESNRFNDLDRGDIALLYFAGAAPKGYMPAQILNQKKYLLKDGLVTIAGYGINNGTAGGGAGTLRRTNVKISDPDFSKTEILLDQRNNTGACHGDSGGPAFVEISKQLYVFAITSRGINDEKNDCSQFSAYTLIGAHRTWLNRMIRKLETPINSIEVR